MWTELKRSKNNKVWFVFGLLLLFVSNAKAADQGKESIYWVAIGDKQDNLSAVQEAITSLPEEIDKQELRICLDDKAYALVHTGAKDPDAAFLIREKLSRQLDKGLKTELVRYDPAACFATTHFLKKSVKKDAARNSSKSPPQADSAPEAVHLRPAPIPYDPADRAETATDQARVLPKSAVKVLPEISTQVYLSNLDINRITCMGDRPVKDVIFSAEKGVTTKINGANAFVKLQLRPDTLTAKPGVVEDPIELYVVCGSEKDVYTIIGIPRKIPAQWIQLTSKGGDIKKNLALFAGKDFEKKILTLVKQAFTEHYPDSYAVMPRNQDMAVKGLEWLDIVHRRSVRVEGEGLLLNEYQLQLKTADGEKERRVLEKQFLVPGLTESPLAVTLDSLIITKDRWARLFIIERAGQETHLGVTAAK